MEFVGGRGCLNDPEDWGAEDQLGELYCLPERGEAPGRGDIQCRFGLPGDLIYTKEAHCLMGWWVLSGEKSGKTGWTFFRSPKEPMYLDYPPKKILTGFTTQEGRYKRSPLFMEKQHARQWCFVMGITVERL